MSKKNKIGGLALAGALLLTCAAAGTIAKYQTELGGTDTASVAKFEVKAGDLNKDLNADLSIFKNPKDSDGTNAEADVATNKIAPGTAGVKEIEIENTSEVTVEGTITAKMENTSVPIELAITESDTLPSSSEWTAADAPTPESYALTSLDWSYGSNKKKIYVHWRWAFGEDDASISKDNSIAENATTLSPKLTVKAVLSQKD